jgi:hypothetical protein
MRALLATLPFVAILAGCGSTAALHAPVQIDFAVAATNLPHVGETRVLAKHVPLPPGPRPQARSVALADGASLLLWTDGDIDWGRRAMGQAFDADGRARTSRFVLSSPAMDVMEAPAAVTADGHSVVATFRAAENDQFELVAVAIEGL